MFEIVCVTNRKLVCGDFLRHIQKVVSAEPDAIILREKDLSGPDYLSLAKEVKDICEAGGVKLILHSDVSAAQKLNLPVHLPLPLLKVARFDGIKGASCHSVSDALLATRLGCSYITAGHIFDTECKRGLPGRGIEFLGEVVASVRLPVYAIGGIDKSNIAQVKRGGASGACVMSGAMKPDAVRFITELKNFIK